MVHIGIQVKVFNEDHDLRPSGLSLFFGSWFQAITLNISSQHENATVPQLTSSNIIFTGNLRRDEWSISKTHVLSGGEPFTIRQLPIYINHIAWRNSRQQAFTAKFVKELPKVTWHVVPVAGSARFATARSSSWASAWDHHVSFVFFLRKRGLQVQVCFCIDCKVELSWGISLLYIQFERWIPAFDTQKDKPTNSAKLDQKSKTKRRENKNNNKVSVETMIIILDGREIFAFWFWVFSPFL